MSTEASNGTWTGKYRSLGLINNPFTVLPDEAGGPQLAAITIETYAASNQFIRVVNAAASEPAPRPLWVEKSSTIPNAYPLKAISKAENIMATDDDLDVLHAYVQLYLMRTGRIRATLGVIGERLAFRSFDRTLAAWVERVLAAPDDSLTSYQVLGPDALARFATAFAADPLKAIAQCFGEPEMERQLDLAYIADRRLGDLKSDVEEDDSTQEVDSTVGEALGVVPLTVEDDEKSEGEDELVADYLIEYAKQHLSPVIARALRTYQARGLVAMSTEFRVTKAPRKTLRAVVSFAKCRFRKIVIIYDGFEGWINVPDELREKIVESLGEIRDILAGDAFVVVMAQTDSAPELEESLAGDRRLMWTFENLPILETERDILNPSIVDHWLRETSLDPENAMDMSDPVLQQLAEAADGSSWRFAAMAAAAIDDAAGREASSLDEIAAQAGLAAKPEGAGL